MIITNKIFLNLSIIIEFRKLLLWLSSDKYNYLKISAIAFECGFNSLSVFNQVFKKQFHMTPSEYRNHTQAKPISFRSASEKP
ncbi:MAG: AraC family transcriptional regulator [Saprospiraceae bacterium]|nr:AraC family transcriptional regulator [Saprospiraceae bacterium]